MDLNDLEAVMQVLDDKLVRTDKGSFIAVEDLRALQADYNAMKKAEAEAPRSIKTMAAAKAAAMDDDEFVKAFTPKDPVVDHVNPVALKEKRSAAETA